MNIAVADEGGNLVSRVRMDGAWLGSIDISIKKAYTSRAFDVATKDIATHSHGAAKAVNEIGISSPSRHGTDAEECACRSVLRIKEPI